MSESGTEEVEVHGGKVGEPAGDDEEAEETPLTFKDLVLDSALNIGICFMFMLLHGTIIRMLKLIGICSRVWWTFSVRPVRA
jgi:hypothetical protein